MVRKRRKPVAEQGEQPLPRNKQMLQLFLDTIQQFLKVQDGYIVRQRIRLRQMRDCLTSPEAALRQQPVISELREITIKDAASGLADATIVAGRQITGRPIGWPAHGVANWSRGLPRESYCWKSRYLQQRHRHSAFWRQH